MAGCPSRSSRRVRGRLASAFGMNKATCRMTWVISSASVVSFLVVPYYKSSASSKAAANAMTADRLRGQALRAGRLCSVVLVDGRAVAYLTRLGTG